MSSIITKNTAAWCYMLKKSSRSDEMAQMSKIEVQIKFKLKMSFLREIRGWFRFCK